MRIYKPSNPVWIGAAIILILLVIGGFWMRRLPWIADFSKWSPAGVFQMIVGKPVPSGVSDIRVSGRHYFTKRWVYMRFQASDAAMRSLAAMGDPRTGTDAERLVSQRWSATDRYDAADLKRVGWPGAAALAGMPTYALFTRNATPWMWQGVFVEDRRQHIVYLECQGD